jgi:hypothetical protein
MDSTELWCPCKYERDGYTAIVTPLQVAARFERYIGLYSSEPTSWDGMEGLPP